MSLPRFPKWHWLPAFMRRRLGDESGVATLEFVLAVPLMLTIFLASFESGLFMIRKVALEGGLDMMVRDLRLGLIEDTRMESLKREVCKHTTMLPNCTATIKLELTPVDMVTWKFPTGAITCVNRAEPVKPDLDPFVGGANQVMLIRACATVDAISPTTGIGLGLSKDATSGYFISAVSGFVNEP